MSPSQANALSAVIAANLPLFAHTVVWVSSFSLTTSATQPVQSGSTRITRLAHARPVPSIATPATARVTAFPATRPLT